MGLTCSRRAAAHSSSSTYGFEVIPSNLPSSPTAATRRINQLRVVRGIIISRPRNRAQRLWRKARLVIAIRSLRQIHSMLRAWQNLQACLKGTEVYVNVAKLTSKITHYLARKHSRRMFEHLVRRSGFLVYTDANVERRFRSALLSQGVPLCAVTGTTNRNPR